MRLRLKLSLNWATGSLFWSPLTYIYGNDSMDSYFYFLIICFFPPIFSNIEFFQIIFLNFHFRLKLSLDWVTLDLLWDPVTNSYGNDSMGSLLYVQFVFFPNFRKYKISDLSYGWIELRVISFHSPQLIFMQMTTWTLLFTVNFFFPQFSQTSN